MLAEALPTLVLIALMADEPIRRLGRADEPREAASVALGVEVAVPIAEGSGTCELYSRGAVRPACTSVAARDGARNRLGVPLTSSSFSMVARRPRVSTDVLRSGELSGSSVPALRLRRTEETRLSSGSSV